MMLNLKDCFPSRGTILDSQCVTVYSCAIQLMMAANKNVKHQYVIISAKAIHYSSEIILTVENTEKSVGYSGTLFY